MGSLGLGGKKNQKRGQPGNAGQFASDTRGAVAPNTGGPSSATQPTYARDAGAQRPTYAPGHVTVSEDYSGGQGSKVMVAPNGRAYRKYYDEYGSAGSRNLGRFEQWLWRKRINEAVEAAWQAHDETAPPKNASTQAAEKKVDATYSSYKKLTDTA